MFKNKTMHQDNCFPLNVNTQRLSMLTKDLLHKIGFKKTDSILSLYHMEHNLIKQQFLYNLHKSVITSW